MDYASVRQCIQELVYNLNVPSRWGTQRRSPTSPSTGSAPTTCAADARDCGQGAAFCYGDLQAEMDLINRAYIDVMTTGDAKGRDSRPTTSPRIFRGRARTQLLFEMTAKYGLPYFQNFINSELEPNMVRSMCCRLQLDLRELLKRGNGLFGSAEQTGSLARGHHQLRTAGYLHAGNETRAAGRARPPARTGQTKPGDQAQAHPAPHGPGPVPLPSATWARCATTSARWASTASTKWCATSRRRARHHQ